MPPKASKRKAANGYKLPDPLPEGLVITAINKKQFRLGKSIGVGGFGEIYLASEDTSRSVGEDATLALKIEPHENGPLFVEMNFYIRAAQPDAVADFAKEKGIVKSFGMPCLRGSGSHTHKGERYRFLVMDRFGKDLQKIFQTGKKLFSDKVTYNLALKILDVLEYIHSKGYVHNDIKAQNLLLGYGRTKENDVYLVDFGLVSKYHKEGVHLEYKPDARKAHDGTIEYTSRDAHIGAHSRRSDLEILGYNLVHWMSGDLPWMDNLANPKYVQAQKNGYMNDVPAFLQRCFKCQEYPDVLEKFLDYVTKLEFDTGPDYDLCREMFRDALVKKKYQLDGKIDFSTPKKAKKVGGSTAKKVTGMAGKRVRTTRQRIVVSGDENDDSEINESVSEIDESEINESVSEIDESFDKPKRGRPPKKKSPRLAEKAERPSKRKAVASAVFVDNSSQTSPAFEAAAKAAKKAQRNIEMDEFVATAEKDAKKAVRDNNVLKAATQNSPKVAPGLDNPTPAMLALMQKKAAENESASKRKATKKAAKN